MRMREGTFEIWARWTTTTRGGKEKRKSKSYCMYKIHPRPFLAVHPRLFHHFELKAAGCSFFRSIS